MRLKGNVLAFCSVVVVSVIGGCDSGFRIGNTWLVQPNTPLSATQVEVVRYDYDKNKKSRSDEKKLVVQLVDGRTSLEESDGRVYPSQLPDKMAQHLRECVVNRAFRVARVGANPRAQQVQEYVLTLYDGEKAVGGRTRWAVPSRTSMPDSLEAMTAVFNRADRMVHPLSQKYNLVK